MTATERRSSTTRLLTRHFLRRFFDNDLISPHIDLHENTATACATVVSLSLFLSVMIAGKYLMGASPPGVVWVETVADNFFFIAVSMAAMALLAALQWDALSLDARDTANLGPLPIARRALVQAKLAALVIFALGFAIALNVFPSTVLQTGTTARMPVGFGDLLRLVVAHLVASMLASAFGFLAIVGLRELVRALLGPWFARVSTALQGILVLGCLTALLLAPVVASDRMKSFLFSGFPQAWSAPPLWFVGLEQTLGGGVIANAQGFRVAPPMVGPNSRALAAYHANQANFEAGAFFAIASVAVVFVLAAASYAWNLRRLPQPIPSSARRRALVSTISVIASGGDRIRRAGLGFALRAIARSAPHRLSMAAAAALAIAFALALLGRAGFRPVLDPSLLPGSIVAVQTGVITILLAGFRRAVRVPAELRANWVVQLSWQHGERRFLSGVKRAAMVGIAAPLLVALLPLHLWLLSAPVAFLHLAVGAVYSVLVVEVLFFGCVKVPFAASYEPLSHVKTLGPIVFLLFLIFVNVFARLERDALKSVPGVLNFIAALAVIFVVLRVVQVWQARKPQPMKFDEPPEPATQWLGLSG